MKKINNLYIWFIALLPLVYTPSIFDPVLIPRQIYLGLFLLAIIPFIKLKSIQFSPILCLVWTFISINAIVSYLYAPVISESINFISKWVLIAIFIILTSEALSTNQLKKSTIIRGVVYFAIVALLIAKINSIVLFKYGMDGLNLMVGTFGNKNCFAGILFLTLPFISQWNNKKKYYLILAVLCFIVLLQCRAAIGATIIWLIFQKECNYKYITILAICFVLFGFYYFQSEYISNTTSVISRINIWDSSIVMWWHNIAGVGSGNWHVVYPQQEMIRYQRPHNDFIWVLCESGISGLIAYLSIFWYALKAVKYRGVILGFMFISFFDFPMERIEHMILFGLILSIIISEEKKSKKRLKFNILLLIIPVLLCIFVAVKRYQGEYYVRQSYIDLYKGNPKIAIMELEMAKSKFYLIDNKSIPVEQRIGDCWRCLGYVKEANKHYQKAIKYE